MSKLLGPDICGLGGFLVSASARIREPMGTYRPNSFVHSSKMSISGLLGRYMYIMSCSIIPCIPYLHKYCSTFLAPTRRTQGCEKPVIGFSVPLFYCYSSYYYGTYPAYPSIFLPLGLLGTYRVTSRIYRKLNNF